MIAAMERSVMWTPLRYRRRDHGNEWHINDSLRSNLDRLGGFRRRRHAATVGFGAAGRSADWRRSRQGSREERGGIGGRTHLGQQLIKPFVMPPSVMLLYMQLCGASAWIAWAFDRCRSAIAWSAACWAVMSPASC
jgi:hypothetical protein